MISGDTEVCPDEMTTLTASAGSSYNWNNFGTGNNVNVGIGDYSVTVTDANGCISIAATTVSEAIPPSLNAPNAPECSSDLTTYSIRINTDSDNVITASLGTVGGGGGFFNVRDIPADVPVTLTATDPATGCTTSRTFESPDCSCPPLAAPQSAGDIEICTGDAIRAVAVSGAGINSESEVRWYNDATSSTVIGTGLDFTPTQAGSYFAEIFNTTTNCNSGRTEVRLIINDLPNANIAGAAQVCPGEQTNLTASLLSGSANSFTWSSSANSSLSPSVTVGAGSYSVTVTDNNGCAAEATQTISEFTVTPASINGDAVVCPGDMTLLTASAGASYNWSNFAQGDRVNVGVGNYSVTVTDNNGCESVASQDVNEATPPTISSPDAAECSSDLTTYSIRINTASGNEISAPLGTIGGGGGFFNIRDIPADIPITVTVTDPATGCTGEQTFQAPDCSCPPLAAPQSLGDIDICAGQTIPALSVSGAGINSESEIRWYSNATSNAVIGTGLDFMPSQAGSYFAEIFNTTTNCQSGRTEVRLIVNPEPSANISGAAQVCPGTQTQLSASLLSGSADNFTWSSSAGGALSPSVMVGAGEYSVTITDANGCTAEATQTISEFDVVPASISGDAIVCPDEQTALTASAGVSYNWSNFAQSDRVNVGVGSYSVTVTDGNGCESIASQDVSEATPPSITSPDAAECSSDLTSYTIRINTESGNEISTSLGTVGGGGGFFNVRDIPADIPVTITVTDPATGCQAEQSFQAPDCSCPPLAAPQSMGDVEICEGETIMALSVSGAGINDQSEIRWYNDATSNASIATGLNFTPTQAGSYFAEIFNTTTNCNSGRTEIRLIINDSPSANISGAAQVCPSTQTQLSASLLSGNADNFMWSSSAGGALSPSVMVGAGEYSVTITDANGCTAEATQTISEFDVVPASISGDAIVCPDEQTALTASAGVSYNWSNFAQSDRVNVGVGSYSVTVTDGNGCESIASQDVSEATPPSITSPDAAECSSDLTSYTIRINTESGNEISTSLGTVGGGGGFFNVRDIPADIPVTITVTDPATGCTAEQSFQAPDCSCPPTAAPQSMGDIEICEGETIQALSVSGAGINNESEVRWYADATSNASIAAGLDFTPTQAGSYFAEIFNTTSGCASGRTELRLIINDLPTANIVGAAQVCPGLETELSASLTQGNATNFEWSSSADGALSPSVMVGAGDYSVTITDANACQAEASQTVTEQSVEQATISGDLTVCPDEQTMLTASAGLSYNWSNFAQSDRVNVSVGMFSVTVTDNNGCESVANATVTEDTPPMIELVDGLLECSQDRTSYGFQINTDAASDLTVSLGTVSGGGGFFTISDVTAEVPVTVTVTNPTTGCSTEQVFQAPDCSCPSIAAPMSNGDVEICADATIPAISVSGAGVNSDSEIRWYNDATSNTEIATGLEFTPSQAGSYFAEIFNTSDECSSGRTEVRLIINDLPTANISGAAQVCPGLETELSASLLDGSASTFNWSTGASSPSIVAGIGTYMVTVIDANGCQAETSIEVTELSVEAASIDGDLMVCPEEQTLLTASGGISYEWNNFAQSNQVSVGVGTYMVTVTDGNGCESEASAMVSENEVPSITLVNGILECDSGSDTYNFQIITEEGNDLSVSLGDIISGSGGQSTISNVPNEVPVTVTVTNPTTGCSSEQVFQAPDCSCPQIAAPESLGNVEICDGDALPELSVSGAGVDSESEVRWYDVATNGIALGTGLTFTPTQAGTYFAEIINTTSNCQSARTEVRLVVNTIPTANIAGASNVCPDTTTPLTANLVDGTAVSFQWSSSAANATDAMVEVVPGVYSVTIIDGNGCESVGSKVVEEFPATMADIEGTPSVCPGETTELTAMGGTSYEWSNFTQGSIANLGVGDYTVTVTDANGCTDIAAIEVTENTVPTLTLVDNLLDCADDRTSYSFQVSTEVGATVTSSEGEVSGADGLFSITSVTADVPVTVTVTSADNCVSTQTFQAPDCNCPSLAAPLSNGDVSICTGVEIPALSVSDAGLDADAEIRWYASANSNTVLATGSSFMPTAAGTYFAEIFNTTTGCTSTRESVTLSLLDELTATISGATEVCEGVTTSLSVTLDGSTATSFQWTGDITADTQTIEVGAGTYTVMVSDANGCSAEASIVVEGIEAIAVEISGDLMICAGETTVLTAANGDTFTWGDGSTGTSIEVGAGTYTVTAMDANGCSGETSVTVEEIDAPSLDLVGALACSGDLTSYSMEILTEDGNDVTASEGTVSVNAGVASVTGIPADTPVTITITNATGCVTEQVIEAPDCNCPPVSAPMSGGDVVLCAGDEITALTVSDAGLDADSEIRWYASSADDAVLATGASFTPTMAGEYFAEIFNTATGCASTRQAVTLTIRDELVATINGPSEICDNPDILAELTVDIQGGTAATYQWSASANEVTTETVVVGAGDYAVTITDMNGCTAEASITINALELVPVEIEGIAQICPGATTTLTATNGDSFTWSDGSTSNTIEVGAGTYIVDAFDTNGCPSTASITVEEQATPSLDLATSAACSDDLTSYSLEILTEDGNDATATEGTVNINAGVVSITGIAADTPVTVTITNAAGCISEQTFDAPDCNCPDLALPVGSGDVEICAGDEIPALTATSEGLDETRELRWFDADIDGSQLGSGTEFTPTMAGTYFVELFDPSSGCNSARIPVTLTVNDLPTAMIDGAAEICPGTTSTLTASGGDSYAWTSGDMTASIEAPAGDYTVIVTDANGCQAQTDFSVTETTVAEAMITGDLGVCADATTTLTASAGASFQWDNGETTENIEVGVGTYSVIVTDANGCESTAMVEVTENVPPNFSIVQQADCSDDLLSYSIQLQTATTNTLTSNTGTLDDLGGGLWSISQVDVSGGVIITIEDGLTGCTTDVPFEAPNCDCETFAAPTSDGDMTICMGDAIPSLSVSDVDETLAVNWYDAPTGGNLVGTGASFTPTMGGTYYAEAVDTDSGCTSLRTEVTLTMNALPDAAIAASADGACGNDTVTLTASGGDNFAWTSSETTAAIDVVPGSYTVTVTDANGCANTAVFTVASFPTPTVTTDADAFICGSEFSLVTADGGDTYQWSTGETSPTVQLGAGTYSVTASNAEGCTDMIEFTINTAIEATADLGDNQVLCDNETIALSPGSFPDGAVTYEWSNGATSPTLNVSQSGQYAVTVTDICDNQATSNVTIESIAPLDEDLLEAALGQDTTLCVGQVAFDLGELDFSNAGTVDFRWQDGSNKDRIIATEEGTYSVMVSNECEDAVAEVEVAACDECSFYMPNAFSPNGDITNDEFRIFTNCEIENFQLRVFDRWGGIVFETQDINEGWNGLFRDEDPVTDAFVWTISYDKPDRYGVMRNHTESGEITIHK